MHGSLGVYLDHFTVAWEIEKCNGCSIFVVTCLSVDVLFISALPSYCCLPLLTA